MGTNIAAAHLSVVASPPKVTAPAERPGRDLLTQKAVAEAAERLAAPSAVVSSVLELIDGGSAPVRAIAQRVAQSPEIAAQLLRLANSALFGEPVDSLDRAIVRIGERSLRGLLLAASTYRLLEGELRIYGVPRLALFTHSNEVATMAQAIATRLSAPVAPQAFLAGLVHDLGKPILAEVARTRADLPVVRNVSEERAVFGTDHARVGTWIAKRWSLPEDLCQAMEHHHDQEPPESAVARAVWLADLVVRAQQGEADAISRLPAGAEACGLPSEGLESLLTASSVESEEPQRPSGLTDRELQVLRMLATGAAAKQVALQLGCSVSTVHNHLHHVYRKLNVTGQAQALLLAREMGWV